MPLPPGRRRRRRAFPFALATLALAGAPVPAGAAVAQTAERIASYGVDIRVEATGATVVEEVIDYDFGNHHGHGIFRDIPVRLRHDERFDRVYPLSDLSVAASPGTPARYEADNQGGRRHIRIGDPDRTVTGLHRYTIRYRVEGALNAFSEHDELYWNAIGADWDVPVEEAHVRVTVPAPLTGVACFSGPAGSNLPCTNVEHAGATARFADRLEPREALTVVVGFPKGVVPPPTPVLQERWTFGRAFEVTPTTVGAGASLLAAVLAGVAGLAWKTGRDRRWAGSPVDAVFGPPGGGGAEEVVPLLDRPETPVEYEPPDGLLPGEVGTLVDESANALDVSATIVHLAVRDYLRIEEIPKKGWFGRPDWNLVKLRGADGLRRYERLLFDGLFRDGDAVRLSELRDTFAARLDRVQDALYDDVVEKGWFKTRPDRVRTVWAGVGVAVLVLAIAAVVAAARFTHFGLVSIPLVIGGLLLIVFARRMPRRTAMGTAVLRRVQGFRRFIEESEKERARFAERHNLFSEYLPYAVVFGATEKWARAFSGLDQAVEPSWYVGSGPFSTSGFGESIDGFTVNTAGTIASTPSGSGRSGFSGGSSGGGGGGGGGGSW